MPVTTPPRPDDAVTPEEATAGLEAPARAGFRKASAYTTAVKTRSDARRARIEDYEMKRWDAEMQICTLEAQEAALNALQGDLGPETAMLSGVEDELRRQRLLLVSLDAALAAIHALGVPEAASKR